MLKQVLGRVARPILRYPTECGPLPLLLQVLRQREHVKAPDF
jgi:hypothetical protein